MDILGASGKQIASQVTAPSESQVMRVHERRGPELFGLCRRLGLTTDEANDAVQEAFARLLSEASRGVRIVDPEAWAFRVVYRLAMDAHRLRRAVQTVTALLPSPSPVGQLDPLDRIVVWAEVDRLPPRQRAVIYLHYRSDLTFERVGAVMGITPAGARNDASVALATLRRRLAFGENDR